MLNVPLLLVGDATDGPAEEIVTLNSLEQLVRLFGAYTYERTVATSGTTGFTLATLPWADQVVPMVEDSDGLLIPTRLFEFRINGQQLSWSRSGDPASGLLYFRVFPEPGPTSLLKGVLAAAKSGATLSVLRLGGTHAQVATGDFLFRSIYPGSRYNGTTITVAGSTVAIVPAPGTGRRWTYTPASDLALARALEADVTRGRQTTFLAGPNSETALTLPAGTYVLGGGADGSCDAAALSGFVNAYDLLGVDLLCPVGQRTDGIPDTLALLQDADYPTLVVAQAPSVLTESWPVTGTANTLRHLVSVAFDLTYDNGAPIARTDDAAPLVAALLSQSRFGLTLAALPESPALPHYSPDALHALAASGHTAAYRSISKGWALWLAVTGDPAWPVSTFRAFQEIVRPVYDILEPALGNTLTDTAALEALLATAFSQVEGSRVTNWRLDLQGDTIYAAVEFIPWGEIRTVRAQIALGTPQSIAPV